jgi:hypothetical protein
MLFYMDYLLKRTGPFGEDNRLVLGCHSSPPPSMGQTSWKAQEFQDAILMRYGLIPPDLSACCDGCDAPFTLQYALCCKKGGLMISCHNKIWDELIHMAGKATTPSAICDKDLVMLQRNPQLAPPMASAQS